MFIITSVIYEENLLLVVVALIVSWRSDIDLVLSIRYKKIFI
jgi:hypothetical protein